MERKFESELAKKVAGGNKDNSSKKKGVLFAAVATCALLFGSAAFSIAEADNDNGNCPVTVKGLLDDEVDELTFVGPDPDVKRTMNLKARSFLPSGDADVEYTKILYSVKVHFNDFFPDSSYIIKITNPCTVSNHERSFPFSSP